ncbi:MAG: hypothetical protein K5864_01635 [Bacteroidales bacterium]|nr:hypothetical protein [Bacteroidales bacterium]
MNKLKLLILLSLSIVFFAACKDKDNSEDLIKPYLGDYTVTTDYSVPLQIPVIGSYTYSDSRVDEGSVTLGDNDELIVRLGDIETKGYVDSQGKLHLDPIRTTQQVSIASFTSVDADIYVVFPVIDKPVDGQLSWIADLSVSTTLDIPVVGSYEISGTGTASQVAVKK